jgi:hypothetical protein
MKRVFYACWCATVFAACNSVKTSNTNNAATSATAANGWNLGVALWTFHTFNFAEALSKVDSAGLTYIEPNTFTKAGPALADSVILQLSPAGVEKLARMVQDKGLHVGSVYIAGDSTLASWKHQFDIAKGLADVPHGECGWHPLAAPPDRSEAAKFDPFATVKQQTRVFAYRTNPCMLGQVFVGASIGIPEKRVGRPARTSVAALPPN